MTSTVGVETSCFKTKNKLIGQQIYLLFTCCLNPILVSIAPLVLHFKFQYKFSNLPFLTQNMALKNKTLKKPKRSTLEMLYSRYGHFLYQGHCSVCSYSHLSEGVIELSHVYLLYSLSLIHI